MTKYDFDNTDLAIITLTIIALSCLFVLAEPATIIASIISGILGMANPIGKRKQQ